MRLHLIAALVSICSIAACDSKPKATAESTEPAPVTSPTLSLYDIDDRKPETIELPKEIFEISGIATAGDGRVFAHGDEKGVICQIDLTSGDIVKRFMLGDPAVRADFEGLAIKGDTFYSITSSGELYSFREGEDGEPVAFDITPTGLEGYDIEGLCYEPARDALLLACKEMPDERYKGSRAVYAWSLSRRALEPEPRFLISEDAVAKAGGGREFRPSSIERHPATGSFVVVASQGSAIIELADDGRMLGLIPLPKSVHDQPEGVIVAPDGSLVISNEGSSRGTLVRYPARRPS